MGIERSMVNAVIILLGILTLQGEFSFQSGNMTDESEVETGLEETGKMINIYEEIDMEMDKERKVEAFLLEGVFPACNYDLLGYSLSWSEEFTDYGEDRNGQIVYIDYRAGSCRGPVEELTVFQNMLNRVGITDTEGLEWDEASLADAIMEQNAEVGTEEANALAEEFMRAYERLNGTVPLGEQDFLIVWDEEGSGFTSYLHPGDGGIEVPYAYDNSFWESADGEAGDGENDSEEEFGGANLQNQNTAVSLRDLNRYLLERLFIELNDQNVGECRGEYRIRDYSVTNRYWTDRVIGTDIVFHVVPKAERVEDLEYFHGVLASVGLTDTGRIKEVLADLQVPGEDEWRFVPHPERALEDGKVPYISEPSFRMEAVIEELSGMLMGEGYDSEEAERIANVIMSRYYPICAEWLNGQQEYSFCFRTELNEKGEPIRIFVDRSGGGRWNLYVPHLKTKEEQREAYFQAGYDEMSGMVRVMF